MRIRRTVQDQRIDRRVYRTDAKLRRIRAYQRSDVATSDDLHRYAQRHQITRAQAYMRLRGQAQSHVKITRTRRTGAIAVYTLECRRTQASVTVAVLNGTRARIAYVDSVAAMRAFPTLIESEPDSTPRLTVAGIIACAAAARVARIPHAA